MYVTIIPRPPEHASIPVVPPLVLHEANLSSLDHPLEEMNTIEMQSVTALAHLRAAVLFFIDIRYAVCSGNMAQL